jgi:hypothetical protein
MFCGLILVVYINFNIRLFLFQIDIDFDYIYPTKGNSLFAKWDKFIINIIPLMITNIKDGNSKLLLKRLIEIKETDIGTIFKSYNFN